MVNKNKINFKLLIFIGMLLLVMVGVAVAINFYPTTPTPTAGKGPLLNWVCKDPVNDAVNAANSQCNAKVNDANKKCTDAVVVTQKILMDLSVGRLSTPFKIDIDLPAKTASANIAGEPNGKIALPILINGTFIVDWGDGGVKDSLLTHVYKMPGKYTITVYTLPNAITTVSLTLNKAGNYLTYKDQSGTDRTYITKIVTGNNSPSMNTFTSGGGRASPTKPKDWGIVVENNACPKCPPPPLNLELFKNVTTKGGWDPGNGDISTIQVPDLSMYDDMTITLNMSCTDWEYCPWDFVAILYIQDANQPTIAKWTTPYSSPPGSWTTNISSMISLLKQNENNTFVFWTPQKYNISILLTLSNKNKGVRPASYLKLWDINCGNCDNNGPDGHFAGCLSSTYNNRWQPIPFTIPPNTKKIELYILRIARGHSWQDDNCAEFCNTTSNYYINDDITKNSPTHTSKRFCPGEQGLTDCGSECAKELGVVQDQQGTYTNPRNGWCPGLDIKPIVFDITDNVTKNGQNIIKYKELFNGKDYELTKNTYDPYTWGIPPCMEIDSYIVFWN